MTIRKRFLATLATIASVNAAMAQGLSLPPRETPIPETTAGVPHVQLGVQPNPVLSQKLLERVAQFPGVTIGPTLISLPGAAGFQLRNDMPLTRPEAIVGGREFAHLHPDGSLHASLDPELAAAAIQAGWAIAHPWANQREGWEGFVMIFTPTNDAELRVVTELVEQSYTYITGHPL